MPPLPRLTPPRRLLAPALAAAVILAPAAPTLGQPRGRQFEEAVQRAVDAPIQDAYRLRVDKSLDWTERSLVEVGGFANFTTIYLTDQNDNSRRLFQPEVTFFGRAVLDGAHTFFGRARFQYRDFSPGDSFDGRGDRWTTPIADRYWYEFDLARMVAANEGRTIDHNVNFRGGRQFVDWGAGLTLSEVLYAGLFRFEFGGGFGITALGGVTPPDEGVTDFDASRKNYNEDTVRGFFGGQLDYTTRRGNRFYAYGLYMPDFNSNFQSPRAPLGAQVEFEYDAAYVGIGADGSFTNQLLYLAEFVYQFGESKSDPLRAFPQTTEDISAWALRARLDYVFNDEFRTRLFAEAAFGSGDDDRFVATDTVAGNAPGTDDNAFNSLGFVQTGLAFAPALSNLGVFKVGVQTFPFISDESLAQLQIGVDVNVLTKLSSSGGISEAPTKDDSYLGTEIDFSANWRLTSDLTFNVRYGAFFPSDAFFTGAHTRHFVFAGATLSF